MAKRKLDANADIVQPVKRVKRTASQQTTEIPAETHRRSTRIPPQSKSRLPIDSTLPDPVRSPESSRSEPVVSDTIASSLAHSPASKAVDVDIEDQLAVKTPDRKKRPTGKAAKPAPEKGKPETPPDTKSVKAKRKSKTEKDQQNMPLAARTSGLNHFIGAHVSIAKGVSNSVTNAVHIGANAFAVFLKSQRQWAFKPMEEEHSTLFHSMCSEHGFTQQDHVLPHGSYLVNLASVNKEQRQKALTSFLDDMQRCDRLGIKLYNFHPGNTNGGPRDEACARIAEAIDRAHEHVPGVTPLLETMASNKAGSNVIGGSFEDLASIISKVGDKSRVGVCIDTCHSFSAGYDIVSEEGFKTTMKKFDQIVGRQYLRAWHLNDSKAPFASGRDLHANIGTGFIGLKGFWNVMNMSVWGSGVGVCGMPLILETPVDEWTFETTTNKKGETIQKGIEDKNVWAREIKLLESLVGMDRDSDEFIKAEIELSGRGREKREKVTAASEKKRNQEKQKLEKAGLKKGNKSKGAVKGSPIDDDISSSELSELQDSEKD